MERYPVYCVFHRAALDQWQFIAEGGEDSETSFAAAKREALEESRVQPHKRIELKSLSYMPVAVISQNRSQPCLVTV